MTLRLATVNDYAAYFHSLSQANWDKQVLTETGEVEDRCPCETVIRKFPSCIKPFRYSLKTAIRLVHKRADDYFELPGKPKGYQADLIAAAERINALIEKVNSRRPQNGQPVIKKKLEFKIEGLRARTMGKDIVRGAESGDLAASLLLGTAVDVKDAQSRQASVPPKLDSSMLPRK